MSTLYRIKPLEWKRIAGEEYYEALGNSWGRGYAVCTRRRQWHYWSIPDNRWLPCDSLEAGKAACEAHWRAKLAEVLEEVPEAARDTERLDWLGYTKHGFVRGTDYSRWLLEAPEDGIRTLRAAIDVAMKDVPRGR